MIRNSLAILLSMLSLLGANAQPEQEQPTVYIIPIKKTIEPALLYVVRRGVDEAVRNHADAIIIEMDTPGGLVSAAEGIIKVITHTDIPIYTFVENDAYSAGAIIALSTPHIYMSPGSVIGAATPMMMGPMGGVQDMPDEVQEKMTSAVAAMVRAAAEQGGHDPELAEAMVRADMEYSIDGEVISEKGRLLTLTNEEAERLVGPDRKPLLSEGTVENIDQLLEHIGLQDAERHTLHMTGAEKIARLIKSPGIAILLMIMGFGGLWLEFKTPGFGIFGITGACSLLLLFFGHHIAGLAGWEDIILLFVGIALLALEVFVIPGFGIAGISGIALILASLISMMVEHVPGKWRPIEFSADLFVPPLLNITLALLGSFILALIAGKFLPQTRLFHSLTLGSVSPHTDGKAELIGLEGIARSDLRPGGTALFGGQKIDVVTLGDYIPSQTPVRIVEVHGNRIVVEDCSRS